MMFLFDGAFALEVIALALGGLLLYFIKSNPKTKAGFSHFISWFVMIAAFALMFWTLIFGAWGGDKTYHKMHEKQYKGHYWKERMHDD